MRIKNYGIDSPRAQQMFQRILNDIERRAVLPQLDLQYRDQGLMFTNSEGGTTMVPSLACVVDEVTWHATVIDKKLEDEELTIILTRVKRNELGQNVVGFVTEYEAKPQAAVFVSFDILQFFLERAEHLNEKQQVEGHEDEWVPNPLFHKKLEVENALKAAYPELPPEYTWKANIDARKPDNAPIVEYNAPAAGDAQ